MNEESHWNAIAPSYEDEIFDVFRSDRNHRLPVYFKKYAGHDCRAIDFGCGVGKAFPYLSSLYGNILALDISTECLAVAKSRGYENIELRQADLTATTLRLVPADFGFCCNVVMLPELRKNETMLRNIRKALKPDGTAVLVLPSLESILFSSRRLIDWYRREGVSPDRIPVAEFDYFKGSKRDLLQGIVQISGVKTKHYSEPEIQVMFADAGFRVTAVERLEYEWNTEFESPPRWMKEPYPWDWLVEAKVK
jgi:SAM-dependent methyltransferase